MNENSPRSAHTFSTEWANGGTGRGGVRVPGTPGAKAPPLPRAGGVRRGAGGCARCAGWSGVRGVLDMVLEVCIVWHGRHDNVIVFVACVCVSLSWCVL